MNLPRAKNEAVPPPPGLNKRSTELWFALQPQRARSLGRQVLLGEALQLLTRCDELRTAISEGGVVILNRRSKMARVNPLIGAEERAQSRFISLWCRLGLKWDALIDGKIR